LTTPKPASYNHFSAVPNPSNVLERAARGLFEALASLRLAVTVMVSLALTCLTATLYESTHGTAAAQREFYRTWWFALILALLGANIFCAMMKRYPWKKHHVGFVMAHIGILTLLAGSLVSLHFGMDGNMALFEGETSDRVSLLEKALHVSLPGGHASFPVAFEKRPPGAGREQRFEAPGGGLTLVAEEYQPHVKVVESFEEDPAGSPALHFVLDNPFAREEGWLAVADPARSHVSFGPATLSFHVAESDAQAQEMAQHAGEGNEISFVRTPSGDLLYGLTSRGQPAASGPVSVGGAIETPWMGMKVVVDRYLARATARRTVQPQTPPANDEKRLSAVKVRLEGPSGRSSSEWLVWTEARELPFAGGRAMVAYRAPEVAAPFRVTLLDFNSDKYPGSSMAATYESQVRIDDPEYGVSEHHISMNHPLHYRGYIFFQASFVEGQPMMSIFSVARSPGLPLVYVGVVLITSGVVWMFYVKPYLARRQARLALAARAAREQVDEANPVDPLPARGSGGAQPASSGA
jgi:hypothetical protein